MSDTRMAPETSIWGTPPRSGFGSQFAHPRGLLGRLAGAIMAATNGERSRWVFALLDIQKDDRVLEAGFGTGTDIRRAGEIATEGFVAGVDASDVMLRQASKRNAAAIQSGKVELRLASLDEPLPFADATFTKVYSINSYPFWQRPDEALRELWRALKPGGVSSSRSSRSAKARAIYQRMTLLCCLRSG